MPSSDPELEDNGTDGYPVSLGDGDGDKRKDEEALLLLPGDVPAQDMSVTLLKFDECGEHERLMRTNAALHCSS